MKIKTQDLIGAALDWTVAKLERRNPILVGGRVMRMPQSKFHTPRWLSYSTSWEQGGPIIEREGICVKPDLMVGTSETGLDVCTRIGWIAASHYNAQICRHRYEAKAPTPLVAAMRCYCCAKLGDEIDIPEELCQQQSS